MAAVDGLEAEIKSLIVEALALEDRYGVTIEDDPERNQQIFASVKSLAEFVDGQRSGAL